MKSPTPTASSPAPEGMSRAKLGELAIAVLEADAALRDAGNVYVVLRNTLAGDRAAETMNAAFRRHRDAFEEYEAARLFDVAAPIETAEPRVSSDPSPATTAPGEASDDMPEGSWWDIPNSDRGGMWLIWPNGSTLFLTNGGNLCNYEGHPSADHMRKSYRRLSDDEARRRWRELTLPC